MKKRKKTAVLAMPTKVIEIIARMRVIIMSLIGNIWFPTTDPTTEVLTTNVDALEEAEAAATLGGKDELAIRNNLLRVVLDNADDITNMVQTAADKNIPHAAEIITSAGYYVKGVGGSHEQTYKAVSELPGKVKITAPVPEGDYAVAWFKSLDGQTWEFAGVTYYSSIELDDLLTDTLYFFKYFMNIKREAQGYSPVIACRTKI